MLKGRSAADRIAVAKLENAVNKLEYRLERHSGNCPSADPRTGRHILNIISH